MRSRLYHDQQAAKAATHWLGGGYSVHHLQLLIKLRLRQ